MSERRPPLQGGLAPAEGLAGNVVEVACDESGFSGSNLLDVATPVFTHASVDLSLDEAVQVMTQLRSRLPRAPGEVKAGQLLGHRQADESVESLLAALSGRAYVVVVDKEHFLATRVVDLFLAEPTYAAGTRLSAELRPAALSLYRAGRSGGTAWNGFLAAFVDLVHTKRRRQSEGDVVARFFAAHGELAASGIGDEAAAVLARLDRAHVTEVVTRLADDDRSIPPPLEPLLPALAETVLFWSGDSARCWSSTTSRARSRLAGCAASSRSCPGPRIRWSTPAPRSLRGPCPHCWPASSWSTLGTTHASSSPTCWPE